MAKDMKLSGYHGIGSHANPEKGALWAHQGDDDLPDPTEVKRTTRGASAHRRRTIQVHARINPTERKRLDRLQRRHQLSFNEWLRYAIALDESIRPSEARDYVRRIIPETVVVIAERELATAAESLMAVAARQTDRIARRNLRQDAGLIMDAVAWFTEIRHEYERMTTLPEPPRLSGPATTRKTAGHTTPRSKSIPLPPPTRDSAESTESPIPHQSDPPAPP